MPDVKLVVGAALTRSVERLTDSWNVNASRDVLDSRRRPLVTRESA